MDDQARRAAIAAEYGIDPQRVTICPPARQLTAWEVLEHPVMQAIALAPAAEEAERRRKARALDKKRKGAREARRDKLRYYRGSRQQRVEYGCKLGLSIAEMADVLGLDVTSISYWVSRNRDAGRLTHGRGSKVIDRARARQLAERGLTAQEAAIEMECCKERLQAIGRQDGFSFALPAHCGRPWSQDDLDLLKRMRLDGNTVAQCAEHLNRSVASTKHALRKVDW